MGSVGISFIYPVVTSWLRESGGLRWSTVNWPISLRRTNNSCRSFFFIIPNLSISGTAEAGSNSGEDHDHSGWVIQVCHSAETPTKERIRVTLLHGQNCQIAH